MGRILKLLTTALGQSKGSSNSIKLSEPVHPDYAFQSDSGMLSLRETGELSPKASEVPIISTLSAWAQLQVSSVLQGYLENAVRPL
jgi:hypothetical protein